jgi:hypothetical protein
MTEPPAAPALVLLATETTEEVELVLISVYSSTKT